MSHDINADPEMWELREKFSDRAGFVWLECLSIADRNSGKIGPNNEHLWKILATKCRLRAHKVASIMELCANKGWTKLDDNGYLHVAKWAKYNKTREVNKSPSEPSEPSESSNLKIKNKTEDGLALKTEVKKPGLDPHIKAVADRIYARDKKKFDKIAVWIRHAQRHYTDGLIAQTLKDCERNIQVAENWWPYLDKVIDKLHKNSNAEWSFKESESYKEELRGLLDDDEKIH